MAAATVLLSATPSEAKSDKIRFRCKAETETTQIDARFEERTKKSRKKFRAQFEGSGDGLVSGAQLSVVVDAVTVGSITLVEDVPGEVEGRLRFDSKGRFGKKTGPFPTNFPVIGEGALVELKLAGATVIGCELDEH
jgi:hypothetical protein